jgi:hypothetical protein
MCETDVFLLRPFAIITAHSRTANEQIPELELGDYRAFR